MKQCANCPTVASTTETNILSHTTYPTLCCIVRLVDIAIASFQNYSPFLKKLNHTRNDTQAKANLAEAVPKRSNLQQTWLNTAWPRFGSTMFLHTLA